MNLGMQIADFAWAGGPPALAETLAGIARAAEDAGFDVLGVADHLWQGAHMGGSEQPELECFTTLGVLAANTRRRRLVPLVAGVHFRYPALLAKSITTLDVLSGGRAMLGIGSGWDEGRRTAWGSLSRPSPSGSRCWRKPSRSACVCGAATSGHSRQA